MLQEVRNFLRNLSNCWGIVQRNSSKLGNELVNIFRNASIGTTVICIEIYSMFDLYVDLENRCIMAPLTYVLEEKEHTTGEHSFK
jgi:hypothetical protein